MRFIKGFWTVIGCSFVLVLFLVSQLSATYDPIKTYNSTLTCEDIREKLLNSFQSDSNLSFKLTDSTGTDTNNLNYYGTVVMKEGTEQYEYHLKYNQHRSYWSKQVRSKISLIGAFDPVRGTGGYQMSDPHVEELVVIFEKKVIERIE